MTRAMTVIYLVRKRWSNPCCRWTRRYYRRPTAGPWSGPTFRSCQANIRWLCWEILNNVCNQTISATAFYHNRVNNRTQSSQAIVDRDNNDVTDGCQHVARECVGSSAFKVTAVNVEDDRVFLWHGSSLIKNFKWQSRIRLDLIEENGLTVGVKTLR